MNTNISERTKNLLQAIMVGGRTSKQIADEMGVSINVVTGSLAVIKKNHLAVIDDKGVLSLTTTGKKLIQPIEVQSVTVKPTQPKAVDPESEAPIQSKKEKAWAIIEQHLGKVKRGELLKMLERDCGLTHNGANTYVYNYVKKAKETADKK